MRILVINTGSSSIKYQLFDMERAVILASGLAERIGEEQSSLRHKAFIDGQERLGQYDRAIADHHQGLDLIVELLTAPGVGVITHKSDIDAVGHRVVHGGERFKAPCLIDEAVIAAIEENAALAPLHNPPNLVGVRVARQIFPQAAQVAVFDTAFHQTIPAEAFLYALPYELYQKHRVRRYGFHGTSHWYVTEQTALFLGRPVEELDIITVHLGNGASMAAVRGGRCIDTTMGLTPLEGLVMGTRSGDVDPALPFFLADQLGLGLKDIDRLLNKESGLKGLCGHNDMRQVIEASHNGDEKAATALAVYAYRIKKYIGAYLAALGRLDALVFTAGIGENAPQVRELCCRGLEGLGIAIDPARNLAPNHGPRLISPEGALVQVLVTPTNEELKIAQETRKLLNGGR
ncbi:acetate kinase [Desulfarculus baarsii DSM 2075]|uniref:Acetate kinase n=1 Tax=Desulfarculus baarsii (strain ATCC 33931 / DSM 2075 / LMG 7858 / VKM B-1802 / 2st14) TaxID=644282 RepID=E1QGQ4_DESB2|nr:acetate kinase [Desulfarculus baarsii]ADK84747.1 acetate kinase [Desulfarculus baarsii DSM 2075]